MPDYGLGLNDPWVYWTLIYQQMSVFLGWDLVKGMMVLVAAVSIGGLLMRSIGKVARR